MFTQPVFGWASATRDRQAHGDRGRRGRHFRGGGGRRRERGGGRSAVRQQPPGRGLRVRRAGDRLDDDDRERLPVPRPAASPTTSSATRWPSAAARLWLGRSMPTMARGRPICSPRCASATVVAVSSTASGTITAGTVVPINVTFSQPVTVNTAGGTPQLVLNDMSGTAAYASGSGSTTLTFNYTVANGQNTSDLDYISIGALTLDGGTIVDVSDGNAASLDLPPTGSDGLAAQHIVIQTLPVPAVANISPAGRPDHRRHHHHHHRGQLHRRHGGVLRHGQGDQFHGRLEHRNHGHQPGRHRCRGRDGDRPRGRLGKMVRRPVHLRQYLGPAAPLQPRGTRRVRSTTRRRSGTNIARSIPSLATARSPVAWRRPSPRSFTTGTSRRAFPSRTAPTTTRPKGTDGNIDIPGDSANLDFPSFRQLNADLSAINYDGDPNEEALLSFAVGVKATMNYADDFAGRVTPGC